MTNLLIIDDLTSGFKSCLFTVKTSWKKINLMLKKKIYTLVWPQNYNLYRKGIWFLLFFEFLWFLPVTTLRVVVLWISSVRTPRKFCILIAGESGKQDMENWCKLHLVYLMFHFCFLNNLSAIFSLLICFEIYFVSGWE